MPWRPARKARTRWRNGLCPLTQPPAGCTGDDAAIIDGDVTLMSLPSRSGKNHVAIGGPARTFHLTSETVTIPSTVRKAELSVYLWIVTKRPKLVANDVLTVEIRNAAGRLLETLGTYSNLDANSTYTLRRFDVTRYRGASIRVSFTGIQSQGPPTYFVLDDAGLNIWR